MRYELEDLDLNLFTLSFATKTLSGLVTDAGSFEVG